MKLKYVAEETAVNAALSTLVDALYAWAFEQVGSAHFWGIEQENGRPLQRLIAAAVHLGIEPEELFAVVQMQAHLHQEAGLIRQAARHLQADIDLLARLLEESAVLPEEAEEVLGLLVQEIQRLNWLRVNGSMPGVAAALRNCHERGIVPDDIGRCVIRHGRDEHKARLIWNAAVYLCRHADQAMAAEHEESNDEPLS